MFVSTGGLHPVSLSDVSEWELGGVCSVRCVHFNGR